MNIVELEEYLQSYFGSSITVEQDKDGPWLRYDTDDNDSREQWDEYLEVLECLALEGLTLSDPQLEHDCISGDIIKDEG